MNETESVTFKKTTDDHYNRIAQILSGVCQEKDIDLKAVIKTIQGKRDLSPSALISTFERNTKALAGTLDSFNKYGSTFLMRQLLKLDQAPSGLDSEALKLIVECFLFIISLEDPDDARHFCDRFQRALDVEFVKPESVSLSNEIMQHLAELMIVLSKSNGLGEEDVDFIFTVTRKEWDGPGKSVGPFLNNIFKEVEMREKLGQDLVARFKELSEMLEELTDPPQKQRILEIIEGLIDADNTITVQEKIFYKIIKSAMAY